MSDQTQQRVVRHSKIAPGGLICEMSVDARPLAIRTIGATPYLVFETDPKGIQVDRFFKLYSSGQMMETPAGEQLPVYVDTFVVQTPEASFIFNLYEVFARPILPAGEVH